MKKGDKILVINEYLDNDSNNVHLKIGDVLIIDKCSKENWKLKRARINEDEWFVSFESLPGYCWILPNYYMEIYKRENNLKILLDDNRR